MARNTAPLGVAEIRKLKPGKRHPVGRRLYLDVGVGTWYARLGQRGAETFRRIGDVDWSRLELSLHNAHTACADMQAAFAKGQDPKAVLQVHSSTRAGAGAAGGRKTFGDAAKAYLDAHSGKWTNELHRSQWDDTLRTYGKDIWNKPVAAVTMQDVKDCMAPQWKRLPTTMQRTLARFRKVFALAVSEGWRDAGNPADLEPIKLALGEQALPDEDERHHRAMPWKDLPAFMRRLELVTGDYAEAACCLRFLIYTAARTQEARDVTFGELQGELWTVPAARMKRRRRHRVPLSAGALAILEAYVAGKPGDRVFPTVNRSRMYELLERLDVNDVATVHGFRSCFDDWASENRIADGDVIDAALAHRKRDKTTRVYRRTDYLEQRVPLMDAWAKFLAPPYYDFS